MLEIKEAVDKINSIKGFNVENTFSGIPSITSS